jgi:hypothetical protein
MSPGLRTKALAEMKSPNFVADLVKRHKFFALALYSDGIGWRWDDSTKAGADSMKLFSEGLLELMRAAQVAPRGVAKMAAAAMESYRGLNKQLDDVIRRKDDLLKLVASFTGDGKFAATAAVSPGADARTFRLDVRASAARLSEVVPMGLLLPFMGAAYFGFSAKSSHSSPVLQQAAPDPAPGKSGAPGKSAPKKANPPKTMEKTTH